MCCAVDNRCGIYSEYRYWAVGNYSPRRCGRRIRHELYAEDEAGNISYMATVLFAVDTSNMCVRVKVIRYATESSLIDYDADCSLTDIRAEIIRCELCGRW